MKLKNKPVAFCLPVLGKMISTGLRILSLVRVLTNVAVSEYWDREIEGDFMSMLAIPISFFACPLP